jgi:hypothetical protein
MVQTVFGRYEELRKRDTQITTFFPVLPKPRQGQDFKKDFSVTSPSTLTDDRHVWPTDVE